MRQNTGARRAARDEHGIPLRRSMCVSVVVCYAQLNVPVFFFFLLLVVVLVGAFQRR